MHDPISTDAYSYYADSPADDDGAAVPRPDLSLLDGPLSVDDFLYSLAQELGANQRWSTWPDVQKGCHGPSPRPDWVVTAAGAIDTDLGILKTGKEADVFLVERAVPDGPASLLAAKRYRSTDHRDFHRDAGYVEGRRVRRSRDARALAKGTTFGRQVAAGQWAIHEFAALASLWSAGVPVPYPVQIDGVEILMEFIEVDGAAAPRLAQVRPDRSTLESYFDQMRDAMALLARRHIAHGDLSAYNILAQGERLVIIDLPQVIDIVGNPGGMEFMLRDCRNVCKWFVSRGLEVDADELFAELLGQAW
ncbi:MAG: kinase 1 [Nocardioidaceae bacterium]|jgi:RIO kinase 1|nr:kinase 1 [Nocardioidaceae bacterium]